MYGNTKSFKKRAIRSKNLKMFKAVDFLCALYLNFLKYHFMVIISDSECCISSVSPLMEN
jgi:hypothetical protein